MPFDVISPRHCGEIGESFRGEWEVDIHDLFALLHCGESVNM